MVFNESEVLRAFDPAAGCITNFNSATVKLWYNDEHALTLGIRQVNVIERRCVGGANINQLCIANSGCPGSTCGAAVTTTTNYPVSAMATDPDHATNPSTGTNFLNPPTPNPPGDDQNGTDTNTCADSAGCGRPMWPVLFITDIGVDPNPRGGDWQYHNAHPNNPDDVFGTWKAAVKTIDRTVSPATSVVTPDADPTKNDWNLDGGDPAGDTLNAQPGLEATQQYVAGEADRVRLVEQGYGFLARAGHNPEPDAR